MRLIYQLLLGAASVPSVLSQQNVNPGSGANNPTFKIAIPSSSSISSSAAGPIYFSISTPSNFQWAAIGTGDQMSGSTMIVIYADGKGNVTVSGRLGRGEVQPNNDATTQSGLTLLAGSGVAANGAMTANIKCTSCKLKGELATSEFIFAARQGSALNSESVFASLQQHNGQHNAFQVDLTQAKIAQDVNPFVAAATQPSGSGTASNSGSTPSSTGNPYDSGSTNGGSTSGGSQGGGTTTIITKSQSQRADYQKAHGIIMGVTVVLLFPIGAMFMRLVGSPWIHGALQLFSLAALIVGFGLGVKLGQITDLLYKDSGRTHTIFGTIILALFLIQPVLGVLHHSAYKKHQSRTTVSHGHIWFGRIIMGLGIINGGLGLKLAANTQGGKIAYGVIAGVVALAYVAAVLIKRKGREGTGRGVGFNGLGGRKEARIHSEQQSVEMR